MTPHRWLTHQRLLAAKRALDPLDLYDVRSQLADDEVLVKDTVARFVDEKVLPIIGRAFEEASNKKNGAVKVTVLP